MWGGECRRTIWFVSAAADAAERRKARIRVPVRRLYLPTSESVERLEIFVLELVVLKLNGPNLVGVLSLPCPVHKPRERKTFAHTHPLD